MLLDMKTYFSNNLAAFIGWKVGPMPIQFNPSCSYINIHGKDTRSLPHLNSSGFQNLLSKYSTENHFDRIWY